MRRKLAALADQKVQENDRNGAIKVIEAIYALADAEERAVALLRADKKQREQKSSLTQEKKSPSVMRRKPIQAAKIRS